MADHFPSEAQNVQVLRVSQCQGFGTGSWFGLWTCLRQCCTFVWSFSSFLKSWVLSRGDKGRIRRIQRIQTQGTKPETAHATHATPRPRSSKLETSCKFSDFHDVLPKWLPGQWEGREETCSGGWSKPDSYTNYKHFMPFWQGTRK